MLLRKDGWRQAMVGSISLYDTEGDRLHTTYIAQEPEHGKEKFLRNFENEISTIKKLYKEQIYIGAVSELVELWRMVQRIIGSFYKVLLIYKC
jgi:ABC-type sulfate transport system substrate-binding protein